MDAAKVLRGELTKTALAFKLPADGKIWGTNYPRPTAVAKVTGMTDYGADLIAKMPAGTLHLALVQANAHADSQPTISRVCEPEILTKDSATTSPIIVNRFKAERIAAHITLTKGERSDLAELATNLL